MAIVHLGLGSNLGDKKANVNLALDLLSEFCQVLRVSNFHKTAPWDFLYQDWFINAAALVKTNLSPQDLLAKTQAIEKRMG